MPASILSRRALLISATALPASTAALVPLVAAAAEAAGSDPSGGLSHFSESIHQEVVLDASRKRVYEALTDTKRFDALTRLSDAVTLLTAPHASATMISAAVGGPFTLFGGYITGRHLEMVSNERLVQAWRAGSWKAGDYSVVRFALGEQGGRCRLVFDHRGFPDGQGANLAYGWRVHYWEPLAKLLAQA
jgi:activator of HSP90 ATPase